ncbi:AbrB/MazE/SpoVT family DNA-binding domain-containing protein [Phreatobacter cathodiphilus]|uniref:AbrB family transcriptional regulator n=1 Tax=Phreatobacter cathodiphilus TaxID=1868589 RepID=A0A2S0N6X9_9HYPH|nr:type II toxin-antitoxin system PrlF family antitoxin [Phreatobacter cathodiphilus]AVO43691.1 AbrB family transcriptional regulator [Phreatobacter cathodiphilus]
MSKAARKVHVSKLSSKSQTVLPRAVRDHLKLGPGDTVRYVITDKAVMIEKDDDLIDDPFITFTEWASPIDEAGYADL